MMKRKAMSGYAAGGIAALKPQAKASAPHPVADREAQPADEAGEKLDPKNAYLSKLHPELRGLADKVAKEGKNGTLTVGDVKVTAGRVAIRVQVTSLSDEVVAKLKELGFEELGRAKSVKLIIGTIDVKQLEALARLTEVRRVQAGHLNPRTR
jgi:hypothetical protein